MMIIIIIIIIIIIGQNRLLKSDQKTSYVELNNGQGSKFDKVMPDADESIKFWSGIWDNETERNNETE